MADTTRIEELEISVKTTSDTAKASLKELETSLEGLQTSSSNVKLKSVIKQIESLQETVNKITASSNQKLRELSDGLNSLSTVKRLNVNKSTANTIQSIGVAAAAIPTDVFSKINDLSVGLESLSSLGKATGLNSFLRSLKQLPEVVNAVNTIPADFGSRMQGLQGALHVNDMGDASKMAALVNSLAKLPTITQSLEAADMQKFANQIQRVADAMRPLADEAAKVYVSLRWLPGVVNQVIASGGKLPGMVKNTRRLSGAFTDLGQVLRYLEKGMRIAISNMGEWFDKTNAHVEAMNLFQVTMQDSYEEAYKFAESVQDIIGIDMTEWMQAQGSIAQVFRGFGVANEDIQMLSQNLTQLGYDIASVFNQDTELVLSRLQSAISGQVKGMREYGVDVSIAAIKQTALELGIRKNVSAMTQAEKAMLRYATIMRNTTNMQGDLARTIATPANALRILRSQFEIMYRTLGKVVSVIATAVIPVFQALTQAVIVVAEAIANLFGYSLPELEYPDFSGITYGAEEAEDALGGAVAQAKKLKEYVMGFDELNVISPSAPVSGGGSSPVGGGVSFELPDYSYDFFNGLTKNTEELQSKLSKTLTIATAIGTAFAGWSIKKFVDRLPDTITLLTQLKSSMSWMSGIAGAMMLLSGLVNIAMEGITQWNILSTTIGGALIGLSVGGPLGAILGAAAGLFSAFAVEAIAHWENVKKAFSETWAEVKRTWSEGFEKLKTDAQRTIENISAFWNKITVAANEVWEEIKLSWNQAWEDFISDFKASVEKVSSFWDRIVEAASETWQETKRTWSDGFERLKADARGSLEKIAGFFTDKLSSVKNAWGTISSWFSEKVITPIEKAFSNINLKFKMPHFEWSYKSLSSSSTMYKILDALSLPTKLPKLNVSWYAQGGFPTKGELFIANEAGAEMIGSLGNKPVVANNQQIIEGIASGVAKANQDEVVLLREQNELLRQMLAKPNSVRIGEREFGEAVVSSINQRTRELGDSGLRY